MAGDPFTEALALLEQQPSLGLPRPPRYNEDFDPDPFGLEIDRILATQHEQSGPGIVERGLGAIGAVVGAPKSAYDWAVRKTAKGLYGLELPPEATTGSMLREAAGLSVDPAVSQLRPETAGYGERLAGGAIEFAGNLLDPTLAFLGIAGRAAKGGALASRVLSRVGPEALGAAAPALQAAARLGNVARPLSRGASAAFATLMGTGALSDAKHLYETLLAEGFSPAAAEETLLTGLSGAFAVGAGRHALTPESATPFREFFAPERAAAGEVNRTPQQQTDWESQLSERQFLRPDADALARAGAARQRRVELNAAPTGDPLTDAVMSAARAPAGAPRYVPPPIRPLEGIGAEDVGLSPAAARAAGTLPTPFHVKPDGETFRLPADQLEEALAAAYAQPPGPPRLSAALPAPPPPELARLSPRAAEAAGVREGQPPARAPRSDAPTLTPERLARMNVDQLRAATRFYGRMRDDAASAVINAELTRRESAPSALEFAPTAEGALPETPPAASEARPVEPPPPFLSGEDASQLPPPEWPRVTLPEEFEAPAPARAEPAPAAPVDVEARQAEPVPTAAQAEAGNYRKGHTRIAGLDISIENPAGSTRFGRVDPAEVRQRAEKHTGRVRRDLLSAASSLEAGDIETGNRTLELLGRRQGLGETSELARRAWASPMNSHYGYLRGVVGKDKDHLDVFVRPGTPPEYDGPVHVVNQTTRAGRFDEHKVMLGWPEREDAVRAYADSYSPDALHYKDVVSFDNVDAFKRWLRESDKRKPAEASAAPPATEAQAPPPAVAEQPVAGPAKEERAPSAARAPAAEQQVRQALADLNVQTAHGALVYMPRLRERLARELPGKAFDEAVLELSKPGGQLQIQDHPTPAQLTAAERDAMVVSSHRENVARNAPDDLSASDALHRKLGDWEDYTRPRYYMAAGLKEGRRQTPAARAPAIPDDAVDSHLRALVPQLERPGNMARNAGYRDIKEMAGLERMPQTKEQIAAAIREDAENPVFLEAREHMRETLAEHGITEPLPGETGRVPPPEPKPARPSDRIRPPRKRKSDAPSLAGKIRGFTDEGLERRRKFYALRRDEDALNLVEAEIRRRAAEAPETQKPAVKAESAPAAAPRGSDALADEVFRRLDEGGGFKNNREFTDVAERALGGTRGRGTFSPRDAYDALEAGVNKWVTKHGERLMTADPHTALDELRGLLRRLPTQTDRTREQVEFQQFSTPPTHALVAARALGIRPGEVVLEPSAGVGSLATFARAAGADVHVNEIAPRRLELLRLLGFEPTRADAEYLNSTLPATIRPTAVLMNPPFSATGGRVAAHKSRYGAAHVEQALSRLEPGGRLVAIVGEGMAFEGPHPRAGAGKRATGAAFRDWWDKISSKYNVRANIGLPGDEYGKYGTTFGNQIIVIDKTGPTPGATMAQRLQNIVWGPRINLEEAISALRPIAGDRGSERTVAVVPAADSLPGRARATGAAAPGGGVLPGARGAAGAAAAGDQRGGPPTGAELPGSEPAARPEPAGPVRAGAGDVAVAREPVQPVIPADEVESDTFSAYRPAKLPVSGLKRHPAPIVESASMAAVESPAITYVPRLPDEVLKRGAISDLQYEDVAYSGQRHSQVLGDRVTRAGYFVGSGTGVGKGRVVSGVILDNWEQGRRRSLWVSTGWDLHADAVRDTTDVAGEGRLPVHKLRDFEGNKRIPVGDGVLFTTYGTLISKAAGTKDAPGRARLDQIKEWLGEEPVIIFDEAHKAKNALAPSAMGEPSQTGRAVFDLQAAIPGARVLYASATGATDVRNMAYMTRLGLWGEGSAFPGGFNEFLNEVEGGGTGAKEMIGRDMKALGMYSARSISFRGVKYRERVHSLTPEQRTMYDGAARAWQHVLRNAEAAIGMTRADSRARALAMSQFWSSQQRFFRQVTVAMKLPTVIAEAEEALAAGKSVVITLKGTGESAAAKKTSKALADNQSLDELDFTPRETLAQWIERSFPTIQYEEVTDTGSGRTIRVPVERDGELVHNEEAVAAKKALLDDISDLALPENPLDQLVNHFGHENVAELTGRSRRLNRDRSGRTEYVTRASKGVPADRVNLHEMQQFQDGKKRVAIISRAASTGISLHSSLRAKNQQPRVQIAAELDWSADAEMQTLGRTHRTDQAHPPEYVLVSTDVGGEKRFSSTIARRIESMGGLTRGQRDATGGGAYAKYNFETREGVAAVDRLYSELEKNEAPGIDDGLETLRSMGLRLDEGERVGDADRRDVPRFLNRVLALDLERQNTVFNRFARLFDDTVASARENGTFDDGVADLKGTAIRVQGSSLIHRDDTTGAETRHYRLEVERPTRPVKWAEIAALHQDLSRSEETSGFYRQKKSGRVAWATRGADRTDAKSGATIPTMRLNTPREFRAGVEPLSEFRARWEPISEASAQTAWEDAVSKIPKQETREHHIIGGAILPIWNRLKTAGAERLRVVRASADDGQRVVGVEIPRKEVGRVLSALGVSQRYANPAETFRAVWEHGVKLGLTEGLELRKTRVRGEDRVELVGVKSGRAAQVRGLGAIEERIDFKNRYFIPNEETAGVAVLDRVLRSYPVVDTSEKPLSAEFAVRRRPAPGQRGLFGADVPLEKPKPQAPVQTDLFRQADMLVPTEARVTEGREAGGPLFQQEARAAARADAERQTKFSEFAVRARPPFYSALERAAEKIPQPMKAEDLARYLRDPKRAVKADELTWTGLDDFLASRKGKTVTPQEVRDFLAQSKVEVRELTKGGEHNVAITEQPPDDYASTPWYSLQVDGREIGEGYATRAEAEAAAERLGGGAESTKFSQWQTPGGKNYRELLLTLPSTKRLLTATESHERSFLGTKGRLNPQEQARYAELNAIELAPRTDFKSGHFDEPNILAHVRFNERTAVDGKRVLFIEEIQSDWAQQGRREGFASGENTTALQRELAAARAQVTRLGGTRARPQDPAAYDEATRRMDDLSRRLSSSEGTPRAPFVGNTEAWSALAFKRMVRWAAEHGFERVAWTTGEMQAARYDLSKQVDAVVITKNAGGTFDIDIVKNETVLADIQPRGVTLDKVEELVGKDLAQKAATQQPGVVKEYSGLDLKVGGEGMKGYYDQILPGIATRLGKKYGARVGRTEIGGALPAEAWLRLDDGRGGVERYELTWNNRSLRVEGLGDDWRVYNGKTEVAGANSLEAAKAEAVADIGGDVEATRVHSLDITHELRTAATEEGFPLFAARPDRYRPADAVAAEFRAQEGTPPAQLRAEVEDAMQRPVEPPAPRLSLDRVQQAFRGVPFREAEGRFRARINGVDVEVQPDATIVVTEGQRAAFERSARAHGLRPSEAEPAGVTVDLGPRVLVQLAEGAGDQVLDKEAFRVAARLALSPAEVRALERRYGDMERAAVEYQRWTPDQAHGLFARIRAFFRRLVHHLLPTAAGTFEAVRRGEVFQRGGQPGGSRGAAYAARPARPELAVDRGIGVAETERAAERVAGRGLPSPVHGKPPRFPINLERINTEADVKQALSTVTDELRARMGAAKGYRSWEEARELALRSGLNQDDVRALLRAKGVLTDHEVTAGRLLREESGKESVRALDKWRAAKGEAKLEAEREYLASISKMGAIVETTVRAGSESGRSLAAHRMLSEGLRPGERFFQKILRAHPGMRPEIRDRLARALVEGDQRALIEAARAANRPKAVDKFLEYWKAGLVSGPPTLAGNVVSNAVFETWRTGERGVAGLIDGLLARIQGREQERFASESLAALQSARYAVPEGLKLFWNGLLEERIRPGAKYESNIGAIGGWRGRVVRFPFRILQAGDDMAKHFAFNNELAATAWRMALREGKRGRLHGQALVDHATDIVNRTRRHAEARVLRDAGLTLERADQLALEDREAGMLWSQADRAAHEATFQDAVGRFTQAALDARRAAHFLGLPLGDIVAPFVKTPSRILVQAGKRTPLGFLDAARVWKGVKQGEIAPGEFADALAKPLLGTLLGISLYAAARSGLVTGSGPADDRKRRLLQQQGWQPYSLRLGDSWVSYKRMEPLASILGLAADLAEADDEKTAGTLADKLQGALVANVTDKSYITGITSLAEAWQDPKRYAPAWLRQFEGSLIPNVFRKAAVAIDPTVRDTRSSLVGPVVGGIPGLSETLPERRQGTGEPIVRSATALERFASPWPRSERRAGTELEGELLSLDYAPTPPQRTLHIPGSRLRVELTDDEYRILSDADAATTARLRRIVASQRWQAQAAEDRRDLVMRAYADGRRAARLRLYRTRSFQRRVEEQLEAQRRLKEEQKAQRRLEEQRKAS